jgi:hypothetical protein
LVLDVPTACWIEYNPIEGWNQIFWRLSIILQRVFDTTSSMTIGQSPVALMTPPTRRYLGGAIPEHYSQKKFCYEDEQKINMMSCMHAEHRLELLQAGRERK